MRVTSPAAANCCLRQRSTSGSTNSLLTMVDTAMVSTITMPVAADKPPMKASMASACWPSAKGSESTKFSGFMLPVSKYSKPPNAIGNTNRLISSMYSGNTHSARRR